VPVRERIPVPRGLGGRVVIPKVIGDLLEPIVQLERATVWADARQERFFEISYYGPEREEMAWEVDLYIDSEDAKLLEIDYPRVVRGMGATMVDALKDALDKVSPS
jgi:hypothetical protein